MNNLEANIIRSFAEVRKEISVLKDEIVELKKSSPKLNKTGKKRK